ncbi:MAG: tryptophan--tRNA ligase [Bacteroidales bacterium]|nr:tryptophan--tRNA ligase [Bacteroidales bacterium]MBN2820825.1 tryptophan--tRNA ligase [Bacteroidales bacterium]
MSKKRVLSCIQPTGQIHLGNYFGAVKNWVDIQDKYECVYGVVDLHAMTMPYNPKDLKENTLQMITDLLACGIDPDKSVLFIQSMVPQHTELTWIFNCVTSYGELSRMTQFKDKSEQLASKSKKTVVSTGLFTYPVLQAADILVYNANYVPVGKDQEQHLELTRNIAVRFNNQFGEFFNEPEPLFTEIPKLMSLADPTKKMSKSLGEKHYIGVFDDEAVTRKKIRSAVTDTGETQGNEMSAGVANLITLLKACGKNNAVEDFTNAFHSGELKYKDLKDATADAVLELTTPFKQKKTELLNDRAYLDKLIREHAGKARAMAEKTLEKVKKLTGIYS